MAGGVPIGLTNLVYAIMIDDPASGKATYQAPKRIVGAISANINPNASTETLFADDGPFETASTIGAISLELNVTDLDLDTQAELLGHTVSGGVLIRKSSDIPPWVAVGFKSLKSNGKYRYTWLAKGKFAASEQANQTKADSIAWNTPTIGGAFVKRNSDDEWERHIDEDHIDYVPSMGANWFNNPFGEAGGASALTISGTTPTDGGSNVPVSTSVVWTFNNPLALSTANTGNFLLLEDGGNPVAANLTINADRTVVTLKATSNLKAATGYRAVVTTGVRDIYGQGLAAASTTSFTTA